MADGLALQRASRRNIFRRRDSFRRALPWLLSPIAVYALWASMSRLAAPGTVAPPTLVLKALLASRADHLPKVLATTKAAAGGLLLACLAVVLLLSLSRLFPRLRPSVMVLATLVKASPAIVFVPALVRLFGNGFPPKICVAAMIAFFPMFIGGLDRISQAPVAVREFASIYAANGWRRLAAVEAAYATCGVLSGARSSAPLAVVGAIVGEYMIGGSASSLGGFIMTSYVSMSQVGVYSGAVLATSLGLAFLAAASVLSTLAEERFRLAH